MANKGNNNQPGERSRARLFFAEVEGSTTEIQQLIQSFANATRSPQQVLIYPQPLPAAPAAPALPPAAAPAPQPGLFDEVPVAEPEAGAAAAPASPPKPSNGTKKKLRTPQLVSDLEFADGPKSLADFIKEIDPKEHSKRYLAIAYWLRQYRNLSEVGGDHIYTCYRALGLNVPKDVGSILRALKSQEWLEPGTKAGFYKVTHIGENQLTKAKE